MVPANVAEDIAKVKSDAQRIDWKRFILILLVVERLTGDGSLEWGFATFGCQLSF